MTIFDKEKRSHLDYAKKAAMKNPKFAAIGDPYNSFSKVNKGKHPEIGRTVTNPLLGR